MSLSKFTVIYETIEKVVNEPGPGLLSTQHWIWIVVCLVLSAGLITLLVLNKHRKWIELSIFISIWALEIVKIGFRIAENPLALDSWVPLHFCSIFLYASALTLSKNNLIKTTGQTTLAVSGFGGACFLFWPSTTLPYYNMWEPWALHAGYYHICFFSVAMTILIKEYKLKPIDQLKYLVVFSIIATLAIIVNETTNHNLMFMHQAPQEIAFLKMISDYNQWLWTFVAFVAQGVILYWLIFSISKLIEVIQKKTNKQKKIKHA